MKTYPDENTFLEAIKPLETWVLVTRFAGPWYHRKDDYYQIELDGLAIDGCGRAFRCSIALNIEGNDWKKVKAFCQIYAVDTVHFLQTKHFNIQEWEVRCYRSDLKPVPVEYNEAAIKDWIESVAETDGLIGK